MLWRVKDDLAWVDRRAKWVWWHATLVHISYMIAAHEITEVHEDALRQERISAKFPLGEKIPKWKSLLL